MNFKYQRRFVLLDLGHPMSVNSVKNIVNSLENILVLTSAFSRYSKQTNFQISVLNSEFAMARFESNTRRHNDVVVKSLNELTKNVGGRITVHEFKNLLCSSIDLILNEVQDKKEEHLERMVEIAIVTKKTAWVLSNILKSYASKLQISLINFKIIQITTETHEKNTQNDCIFCLDDSRNLTKFFKDWFLNPQQEIRISVSNLELMCEVEDCVFDPYGFRFDFEGGSTLHETSTQVRNLEITNRLPINGLCPTLVYGIPRRVKPTRSPKSPTNAQLFQQLCLELNRTGEGLLAKSILPTGAITFHFLASDGDMILMNEVAPDELSFSKRENCVGPLDECDASVVRDCLRNIKCLSVYKAEKHSSGVFEVFKRYFDQDKSCVFFEKSTKPCEDRKRRPKPEQEDVHPALLSPKVVKKYRKITKNAFKLPELSEDFL